MIGARALVCLLGGGTRRLRSRRSTSRSPRSIRSRLPPLSADSEAPENDPSTRSCCRSPAGTRAAAFSYGVLEELHRTEIVVDGRRAG